MRLLLIFVLLLVSLVEARMHKCHDGDGVACVGAVRWEACYCHCQDHQGGCAMACYTEVDESGAYCTLPEDDPRRVDFFESMRRGARDEEEDEDL